MGIILVAPGKPMGLGGSGVALWQPLAASSAAPPQTSATLASIAGLSGWWDSGLLGGLQGPSGTRLTAWGQPLGAITNQVLGGAAVTPFSFGVLPGMPLAAPRLSGLLGGAGRWGGMTNPVAPPLDPDLGFQTGMDIPDWSGSWTWYFVWSRPNWRQGSAQDTGPVTLLAVHGRPILQADGSGGAGRLVLFPGQNETVLTQGLTRRHTHAILLRYQAGAGLAVWLDGTQVAASAPQPLNAGASGPLLFLHDGGALGSAQCWFHEAACWPRALSSIEVQQLHAYAERWYRGNRRGVLLLVNGQSNAVNFALNDGAAAIMAQGVAWHIGALAAGVVATTGAPASYTMQSGHGLYPAVGGAYPGSFLSNPGDGSNPSTWALGADGQAVQQAVSGLSSGDALDICALVWPWNETDSLRDYTEGPVFGAAVRRFLALERAMLGRQAGMLPLIWWSAVPYGGAGGMQMHREAVAALAADSGQNVVVGISQTADSNARGSLWDPTTGIATGGDTAHRDGLDNQRFARLAAPVVARALMAAGIVDSIPAIPAGIPHQGGPRIIHAFRQSNTAIVLTIQHDAGSDLKIPLRASAGLGFAVRDGGTAQNPGPVINAISCTRIDPAHLLITLASPITSQTAACGLYYPYGSVVIGRGNAVTDNFSNVAKPDGWDIAADLGTLWALDCPLNATLTPVALSDTP